ncbi:tetratricopeptide repeat protein [Pleionea sp. CnH1-48]|uniref:tetratricopeptide repeat protein n=1 Tax=Pleionea sp. CnH1-48 TaxID=2954494 RepID=UPI002096E628|nr:tetratricopeptide repeat protein [Pleionea sp. CnH1-48]MCO7224961.1 tetratricopeptide repeat protein [Pleionea sp. CnH1-48]
MITLKKSFLLAVGFLLLTGCAHQRLMDSAQDNMLEGRYEEAVNQYQQALKLEPDDQKTRAKLAQAQTHYRQWLGEVKKLAVSAEKQGLKGKALLLHAKLAAAQYDQSSLQRYNQLYADLKQDTQFLTRLKYNQRLLQPELANGIAGLKVSTKAKHRIEVLLAPVNIETRSFSERRSAEYVSGTETIANPEFLALQNSIYHQKEQAAHTRREARRFREDYRHLQRDTHQLEQELNRAISRRNQYPANSPEYQRWNREVNDTERDLRDIRRRADQAHDYWQREREQFIYLEDELNGMLHHLSMMPPTVIQDVYSTYEYDVTIMQRSAQSDLKVKVDDRIYNAPISLVDEDTEHQAHEIIGLGKKLAALKSKRQMTSDAHHEARLAAQSLIRQAVAEHKNQYLIKAAQPAVTPQQKFELYIRNALAGKEGASGSVTKDIQQHLQLELGIGGYFDVNRLISFYSH